MKDRRTAADALRNAADMLTCAAELVELGEDADAALWLSGIHEALGLALAAQDWAALDTVLLPQFAPLSDKGRRAAEVTACRLAESRAERQPAPAPKRQKVLS